MTVLGIKLIIIIYEETLKCNCNFTRSMKVDPVGEIPMGRVEKLNNAF
jgi:hypothetical protein